MSKYRGPVPAHLRNGSEESRECAKEWVRLGGVVYVTSDVKATNATPGISDQIVVLPRKRLILAWESKGGGRLTPNDRLGYPSDDPRRLSDAQRMFLAYFNQGWGTAGGFGNVEDLKRWVARDFRPYERERR